MTWEKLLPSRWIWEGLEWPPTDIDGLTDWWIQIIIIVALTMLAWAIFRLVQVWLRVRGYRSAIAKVKTDEELRNAREGWSVNKKRPLLGELNDSLVEVPVSGGGALQRQLKRCVPAVEVFNYQSLAQGLIGSRMLLAVPAILTGLGVLGTFVGLQLGIGALDLDQSQIENLDNSIAPLIKGCSTAFTTSVWGVLTSLLFSVIEKLIEWAAAQKIKGLQEKVDIMIPRYTAEESMLDLQRSSLESESHLKGLAVAIGEEMQKAMNRIGQSVTDAVKDALGGQAQDLGKMSADLMSNVLKDELSKLGQTMAGMGDNVKNQFSAASTQLKESLSGFKGTLEGINTTVESSQKAVTQAVEQLSGQKEIVAQLEAGSEKLASASAALLELKESWTEAADKNRDAAEAQNKAASSNTAVAKSFEEVGKQLPAVEKAISEGASVIASLGAPLLELQSILSKTPEIFGEQTERIEKQGGAHAAMLLEQTKGLTKTVADAVSEFAKIDGLAKGLGDACGNLDSASTELGRFANELVKASEQQASAAGASERAAKAGERTAEKMEPLPESLKQLTSSLTNAGGQIKEGAEAARDVYAHLIEHQKQWFSGVENGMLMMKDRLQQILDAYGESVDGRTKQAMEEWIGAVETSLSKFATQVEALEGAVQDLMDQ